MKHYQRMEGLVWLDSRRDVRLLPISRKWRDHIALRYWMARECGDNHEQATKFSVASVPIWVWLLIRIALPILWARLQEWWADRQSHPEATS